MRIQKSKEQALGLTEFNREGERHLKKHIAKTCP